MNGNQNNAFTLGTGNIFNAADLSLLIASVFSVILFLYVSWLFIEAYKNYGDSRITEGEFLVTLARGAGLLSLLLFIVIAF